MFLSFLSSPQMLYTLFLFISRLFESQSRIPALSFDLLHIMGLSHPLRSSPYLFVIRSNIVAVYRPLRWLLRPRKPLESQTPRRLLLSPTCLLSSPRFQACLVLDHGARRSRHPSNRILHRGE